MSHCVWDRVGWQTALFLKNGISNLSKDNLQGTDLYTMDQANQGRFGAIWWDVDLRNMVPQRLEQQYGGYVNVSSVNQIPGSAQTFGVSTPYSVRFVCKFVNCRADKALLVSILDLIYRTIRRRISLCMWTQNSTTESLSAERHEPNGKRSIPPQSEITNICTNLATNTQWIVLEAAVCDDDVALIV